MSDFESIKEIFDRAILKSYGNDSELYHIDIHDFNDGTKILCYSDYDRTISLMFDKDGSLFL